MQQHKYHGVTGLLSSGLTTKTPSIVLQKPLKHMSPHLLILALNLARQMRGGWRRVRVESTPLPDGLAGPAAWLGCFAQSERSPQPAIWEPQCFSLSSLLLCLLVVLLPLLFRNNQMLIAQFKWTIKYVRTLYGDGADKRAGARQSATFNSQPSGGANLIIIQSSPKIRAIQLNILINLKYQANDANYKYPQESRLDERLGSRLILQTTVS